MKYIFKNLTPILICILFIFLLFYDPLISKKSINISFNLWLNNLLPSIFPMIIINDILINYNFGYIISSIFYKPINKIFKLSYHATYIFIMSLFVGTPSNCIILKNYLDKNLIDEDEANKLIYVIYFSNPLFLYSMLNLMFNSYTSIKLIIIHYISNFIVLFLIRNKYIPKGKIIDIKNKTLPFDNILIKSINKSINTLIVILGIISFYNLIISYLPNIFLFKGFIEITNALNYLTITNISNKEILCIITINFGGLSIYSQIKSILEDTSICYFNYFKGRILQIIIGCLICR